MTTTPESFQARIAEIRAELIAQGRRVERVCEQSFESLFTGDSATAKAAVDADDEIDLADVEIERATVRLLMAAACEAVPLERADIRAALTLVKVNNEFERIADAAVSTASSMCERVSTETTHLPPTFRVMTNSVLGIIRDTIRAYDQTDGKLARLTLDAEDTVTAFKSMILREAEERIARGALSVEAAFFLHEVAGLCERMADHCSNVAEQVLWIATGKIVKHTDAGWIEVEGVTKED
ncbi:MAG: PhoU domain-containing protein [Planctomycetota bacterium]